MFVIFAMPRTGSTMLVSALDSHPEVKCHGELLIGKDIVPDMGLFKLFSELDIDPAYLSKEYRNENPIELLKCFTSIAGEPSFGFKLMLNQCPRLVSDIIETSSWPIIVLRRENELACYSSHLIAKATGQGSATLGDDLKSSKVEFDEKRFRSFGKQRRRRYREVIERLEANKRKYVSIDYRSLVSGKGYQEILEHLGVSSNVDLNTRTRKRNSNDIVARFSNPDDVRHFLFENGLMDWAIEQLDSGS